MNEILRDPFWQLLIGILGVGVAILTYFLQRRKKSLSYRVLSETPLLTVKEGPEEIIKGKIKILFEEKPVLNVHLLFLQISNDGNTAIKEDEFEKIPSDSVQDGEQCYLRFTFGQETKILSAEIAETFPKSLKPKISIDSNRLLIHPLLLNSGDTATIRLLLDGYHNKIVCDARIVDVKDVKRINGNFSLSNVYTPVGAILFVTGIALMALLFFADAIHSIGFLFTDWLFLVQFIPYVLLTFLGLTLAVLGLPLRLKG